VWPSLQTFSNNSCSFTCSLKTELQQSETGVTRGDHVTSIPADCNVSGTEGLWPFDGTAEYKAFKTLSLKLVEAGIGL
jgi:hypothetical protein